MIINKLQWQMRNTHILEEKKAYEKTFSITVYRCVFNYVQTQLKRETFENVHKKCILKKI